MRGDRPTTTIDRDTSARRLPGGDVPLAAALVLLHAVLTWPTLYFYAQTADVPVVFLASGVAWAGFMLLPGRTAAGFGLAILLSHFAAELVVYASPAWAAALFATTRVAGAWIGVRLVQRFTGHRVLRGTVSDLAWFGLLGILVVPLLAAAPPQLAKMLVFGDGALAYAGWVMLDACGIAVMAPLLIFWLQPERVRLPYSSTELLALIVTAALVLAAVFVIEPVYAHQHTPFYAATPVMIWAAVRFGCRGASVINLALTLFMVGTALAGLGPFHHLGDISLSVLELQLFLLITTGMTLLLAAYAEARESARLRRMADTRRLQQLSLRLLEGEERYREKIATRLHDGVGQSLALGRMRLDDLLSTSVRPASVPTYVSAVGTALDTAIGQVRDMTRDVASGLYRGSDVGDAVRHHLRTVFAGTAIDAGIDGVAPPELDHDTAVVLSRSIRECLVNVAKHARAATVRVAFSPPAGDGMFRVTIRDDGAGFDAGALQLDGLRMTSFGLASVRNSMLALGGEFDIRSSRGGGTVVRLSVPTARRSITAAAAAPVLTAPGS